MIDVFESLTVVSLIFGGCCSNVYVLEAILKHQPDSGLLITFAQFALAALLAFPTQLPFISRSTKANGNPPVPLSRWASIASMFYAINMLNNWAFAFSISVPVHIILRSFGSVWTMLAGYLRGKRYSPLQIFSVVLLTLGVLVSAWADAESKGKKLDTKSQTSLSEFLAGLTLLLVAQILSAYMGIFTQDTYALYTTTWQSNLFWSQFLSLPLFLPLTSILRRQYAALSTSPPLSSTLHPQTLSLLTVLPGDKALLATPSAQFYLLLNALTQVVCISGVNLLSSHSSAVTVTIVLNIRKLVSFLASTLLFGHAITGKMGVGAGLVFGSGAVYGWETSWRIPRRRLGDGKSK